MKAGWSAAPLKDLASFRSGLWTGKKGPFTTARVLRNTNIRKHGILSLDDVAEIEVETKQLESRRLQYGDIILERSGGGPKQPVGRTVCFELEEENFSFSNFTSVVRVQNPARVDYRFLHMVLNWWYESGVTEGIQSNSTGIRNLDFNAYKALEVPLPALEEQQRIVAVLNEAFEGIARARAHAEANLRDARELFERGLSILLCGANSGQGSSGGHDWPELELRELVTFHNGDRGKNYPNKHEYVDTGIPWLNTGQIMPNGSLSPSKMNFISHEKFQSLGGGRIRPGDLVFCLRGATIGKTAFVAPFENGAVASSLMIIRPGNRISDSYTYYFLTSDLGKAEIGKFIGGAAQPNLAGESVGRFRIRLPPIEQQDQIVETLDRMRNGREVLERRYQEKIQDIDALRQSLLQRAFAGELT